jgi:hypothetical protein
MPGKKRDDEHARKARRPAVKNQGADKKHLDKIEEGEFKASMDGVSPISAVDQVRAAMRECMGVILGKRGMDERWTQKLSDFPEYNPGALDCLCVTLGLSKGQPLPDDNPDDLVSMVGGTGPTAG